MPCSCIYETHCNILHRVGGALGEIHLDVEHVNGKSDGVWYTSFLFVHAASPDFLLANKYFLWTSFIYSLTAGSDYIRFLIFASVLNRPTSFWTTWDRSIIISKSLSTTILSNLNNFHSIEVVDRVSDPQLQVGENSNQIIWRLKG